MLDDSSMSDTILSNNYFFYEPDLQLKVIKRDPELPYRLHSHEFNELVFVIGGRGINYTKHDEQELREGSVFFIPPGVEHGYREVQDLVLYNILIGKNLLSKNFLDLSKLPGFVSLFLVTDHIPYLLLNPSQCTELIPTLAMMEKESDDQSYGTGSKTLAYAYMLDLVVSLSRIYDETPHENNQRIRRLWKVIAYMDENKHKALTSEELTEVANMSTSTLNRYFKTCTGLSPIEFHIHKRIAHACTLIQKHDLSMTEIAEATGFIDPNYFSRQFRRIMAMSPKEYQKIFTSRFS
ncbi:MAG: AraC family transcriptional regulator [Sphaerochaeta sp.]